MLSKPINSKTAILSIVCVAASVIFAGLPYQEGTHTLGAALIGGALLALALPSATLMVGVLRNRSLAGMQHASWRRFTLDGVFAALQVLAFLSVTDLATRFGFGIPGKCAILLQVTRYHLIALVGVAIVQAVVCMRCRPSMPIRMQEPRPFGEVCVTSVARA